MNIHRLTIFQNVLKGIFVPKNNEVIEEYRKLYESKEVLHSYYLYFM